MTAKKVDLPDNTRKRKRIVATRTAGTPVYDVVDELFSAGFANRKNSSPENISGENTLPYPTVVHPTVDEPVKETGNIEDTSLDDGKQTAVSPNKNFTKFSNSIIKQAVPEGLFRGQSKHTYDVLYQHTRGAITPVRDIQLTKTELVKLTGLEIKTIQRHLSFLRNSGLIIVDPKIGDHKGAIYRINVPEEITLPYPTVVDPTVGEAGINYTSLPGINYTTVGYGNPVENIELSTVPKTSLKTNTKNDDEPFGAMNEVLASASAKISGRNPHKNESAKWRELAELIVMELEIAAARADSITSVPAFLTEHLRRRLIQKTNTPKPTKSDKKTSVENISAEQNIYEAEPLNKQGREVVLKTFREYIEKGQRDFVMSFEDTYTREDWLFLMERLEKHFEENPLGKTKETKP